MSMVEHNSQCDVLHITPVRVARLVLDCNGVFAIKAYRPYSRRGHDEQKARLGWQIYRKFCASVRKS